MEGKVRGPSGRWIKIGGPTFRKLSKVTQQKLILESKQGSFEQSKKKREIITGRREKCLPGEVYRPRTKRCIKIDGPTFKKLSRTEREELLKTVSMDVKDIRGKRRTRELSTKVMIREDFKNKMRKTGLGLSNSDIDHIWNSSVQ